MIGSKSLQIKAPANCNGIQKRSLNKHIFYVYIVWNITLFSLTIPGTCFHNNVDVYFHHRAMMIIAFSWCMVDCSISCSAIINYPGSFGPVLHLHHPLIPAVERGTAIRRFSRFTGRQQSFESPPPQGPALYQSEKEWHLIPPQRSQWGGGAPKLLSNTIDPNCHSDKHARAYIPPNAESIYHSHT